MIKNKIAVITGGTRGIGKGIALKFLENNANVVLTYQGNDEKANAFKEMLIKEGYTEERFLVVKSDVSTLSSCEDLVKQTIEKFGTIDILVNNAGIVIDKLMLKMTDEDFSKVINTNLNGSFNMVKAALKIFLGNRSGSIINLSSINGINGAAGQANYSASKAGIIGLTKSLAKELGGRNIRVNAISPGLINTDMTDNISEDLKKSIIDLIPLKREGTPEDIANAALFLASDLSTYVTGHILRVDGGL